MLASRMACQALHRNFRLKPGSFFTQVMHTSYLRSEMSRSSSVREGRAVDDDDHPFYNYTSGKWLYNESRRLTERRHYFSIDALCTKVAQCIHKSADDIVQCNKIAEGGSYRIFEFNFRDDISVIARLPYPATSPRKYGMASEVATMQYLRLHGIPIPKILDWSTDRLNPVKSEYMIMEKVPGQELECTWYTMTFEERKKIMEKIVDVESKLFKIRFPANGSLYLKRSLDPNIETIDIPPDGIVTEGEFCIGPSTEYLWWYDRRHELDVNGGPWPSTGDVLTAVGQRELKWLQQFGQPRLPREPLYREFYNYQMVHPQQQVDNLLSYLKIAPFLEPEGQALNLPTLQHPDLSPNNIFVSELGEITGIIDWQHSVVLPMFLQANIPKHFQNYGDHDSENFRRPALPEDFDSLSSEDKDKEQELYRRRQVHYFYLGYTSRNNQPHFQAMGKHNLVLRNQVYHAAGRPWEGDGISLKATLIQLAAQWSDIVGNDDATCPLKYSEAETEECLSIDEKQKVADVQMEDMRSHFGINIDGWVPNDLYSEAKEKERVMKEQTLEMAETEHEKTEIIQNWPFQDHEED